MATAASPMTAHQFDDRSIQWRELEGFKHMLVSIFFVDAARHRVDFLIKFDTSSMIGAFSGVNSKASNTCWCRSSLSMQPGTASTS